MTSNKYSDKKIFGFPEKIKSFQEERITAPLYVRIKPINRCSHACQWCCVAGTMVSTVHGYRPVESIAVGDRVISADGTEAVVVAAKTRRTRGILQITANRHSIEVTPEHPFLTSYGWKKAGDLIAGETTVVRVRLRESSNSVPAVVERLREKSPEEGRPEGRRKSADSREDEGIESNEAKRHRFEGKRSNTRKTEAADTSAQDECLQIHSGQDALRPESDEGLGHSQKGSSKELSEGRDFDFRNEVQSVGRGHGLSSDPHGDRFNVHREEEPGFQGARTKESNRAEPAYMFQQGEDTKKLPDLRDADDTALPEIKMGVPGYISEAQPGFQPGAPENNSGLRIAGIELERGLELRSIDSIRAIDGEYDVYNFECEPGNCYEANGFIVHNCAYSDGATRAKDRPDQHMHANMHEAMRESDVMPLDKATELINDLKDMGVKAVTFSGGGEPLMHPDICEMMTQCLENGIDISVITNGQSLSKERAQILKNAKWVRVSMDYTSADQMVASRNVPARFYDGVIQNLRDFSAIKNGDLGINFIVTRNNFEGLVPFADFLKGCGVDNIRFSPVYVDGFSAYHEPIAAKVTAQLLEIQSLCSDKFSVNSTYDIDSPSKSKERPFKKCLYLQTVPVVGADLGVYACHNTSYTKHGLLGSIKDQSFKQMWFSPEARKAMLELNPSCVCKHECANSSKVVLFNELAETHNDYFV